MLFPQILIIMNKNIIIIVLSMLLGAACVGLQYTTDRLDTASRYIDRLENDNPDFLDTSVEGDEYMEWYGY